MNKSEVELVLITVKSGTQEALTLKVYKNGIIARKGCGGLPGVGISGMSFTGNSHYFDRVMRSVSQQILDQPVNHEEKILTNSLEYTLIFYGVSANADQGERAEWTKSVMLRFYMDEGTSFRHNLLGFLDGFAIEAMKITNSWYFDIVMMALENKRSSALPEHTLAHASPTDEALEKDFQNYFQQTNKKELPSFVADKTYSSAEGDVSRLIFKSDEDALTYIFEPLP